jgi:uncharacterized protein (DUF1800 family)
MPITPYGGTWGQTQRLHLLRRTLFGASKADIAAFATMSMTDMVTSLLTFSTTPTTMPLVDYTANQPSIDTLNTTWVNSPTDSLNQFQRTQSLRGWWMGLMLQQERNIREKMTFFWHNHVPTDIGSSFGEAHYAYRYNVLLRQSCLGNFKTFIRQVSTQPAMLYYLSGISNSKTAPNENYGRELQELFCIGKDLIPSYTEADVQAAAQVLTGWQVDTPTLSSKFTLSRHTTTNKTFSGFYGNGTPVVITGRNDANAGATELDDLLNMIFAHPEVARYVVRKIYRFFVYYKIDATVETNVIVPLADLFRTGGYEILPVMQALFTSQHFYDMAFANSCMIKSPIDHNIGLARVFGVVLPAATDIVNLYKDFRYFSDESDKQGQKPGNTPNVAGWPAYYQTPNFHELWITADTLRKRKEFCDKLLASNYNNMKVDVLAFTMTLDNPSDPNFLIDEALSLLHPLPSDVALKTSLKAILLSNQVTDSYWTTAWTNYIGTPTNTTYATTVRTRLQTLYQAITNMAEFHLS